MNEIREDKKKIVAFKVAGTPGSKGRPKFYSRTTKSGKTFSRAYTPEKTVNYETLVRTSYQQQVDEKLSGMIHVQIYARFPIVKSTPKKYTQKMRDWVTGHTKKPDADNIIKVILDSLNTIAFDDDSSVCSLFVQKGYSENPCVVVVLQEIDSLGEVELL